MSFNLKRTPIQLVSDDGEVVLWNALLVEGDGLCAIYDIAESHFDYIASFGFELDNILTTERLNIVKIDKDERLCSICKNPMREGFYFESNESQYCNEACLKEMVSWDVYLKIHDNGNGDAYWTSWEED